MGNALILAEPSLSESLSLSPTHRYTHTHFCANLIRFRCVGLLFSMSRSIMSDVCPLRPSGYYMPTDGALPFTACTFCEFSQHPPQALSGKKKKHLFFWLLLRMCVFDSALMRSKRRGRGGGGGWGEVKGAQEALSFWEVMSNDISP